MIEEIKKMFDDNLVSAYLQYEDGTFDDDLHTGKSEQEISEFFDYFLMLEKEVKHRKINPYKYFAGNE